MELMIVIVIIGILTAGSLIIFGDKSEKAKEGEREKEKKEEFGFVFFWMVVRCSILSCIKMELIIPTTAILIHCKLWRCLIDIEHR